MRTNESQRRTKTVQKSRLETSLPPRRSTNRTSHTATHRGGVDDPPFNCKSGKPAPLEFILLEEGDYSFEVGEIFGFKTGKKGNAILSLELLVGPREETVKIIEQLVFTEAAKWKIDAFLKSIHGGAIAPGTKIDFDNLGWLQRRRGTCTVGIEEFELTKGTNAGKVEKKNVITAFTTAMEFEKGEPHDIPIDPSRGLDSRSMGLGKTRSGPPMTQKGVSFESA